MKRIRHRLTSTKIIIFGYIGMILIGASLLCLPFATKPGCTTGFLDALFTATSATCVTGLILFDTFTHWTFFGQLVIIVLIQIGGLGFLTMAMLLATVTKKRIGLKQRIVMRDSISVPQTGGIVRLTRFVFRVTLICEAVGALLLSFRLCPVFGFKKGVFFSIFHSISAFCNAGFDLMGSLAPNSSLTFFYDDVTVNITIMALIIIGGLGFFVWEDIHIHRFHFSRYTLQSKVVIISSAILIFLPAVLFYILNSASDNFTSLGLFQRMLTSVFQSVTTRTAGFNTLELSLVTQSALFLMISLMLIGGSPGSTAGGMKTTTIVIIAGALRSVFRREHDVEIFNRRIGFDTLRRAISIVVLYFTFMFAATLAISRIDSIPLIDAMFEASSAIGTVGLTTGITSSLSRVSQGILIFLMYFGRVGGLTMLYAISDEQAAVPSQLPLEDIAVG